MGDEREYWQWRHGDDSAWNFTTEEAAKRDHEWRRTYSSHTYHCRDAKTRLVIERMPEGAC